MGNRTFVKKNPLVGFFCFALAFSVLTISASAAGSVRIGKVAEKISKENLDCTIEYPQIAGIYEISKQQRLNVEFAEVAKKMRAEAEYGAKSGSVKAKMGFKVTRNQGGIMSLVLTENISTSSGQKPSETGVTIDTVTGRRFLLSDLFIDNADYVAALDTKLKASKSVGTTNKGTLGTVSKISENAGFYLTNDNLVIIEKQGSDYESGCTVYEFAVPLNELKEILKPVLTQKY